MHLTLEKAQEMMEVNEGSLDLQGSVVESLPENLTVRGDLDLQDTAIEMLPENLTVGGSLHLVGTAIKVLPENLTVGRSLFLQNSAIKVLPENLTVGGSVFLQNGAIKVLPENLTVGGSVFLQNSAIEVLPDYLTVGTSLYLQGTAIKTLPKHLAVGGYLEWEDTKIPLEQAKQANKLSHGEYVEGRYLYADHILTPIKKTKKAGPYTYYVGKIPNRHVISDGTHFAHCQNVRQGIQDLAFKTARDRGQEQYKHLTTESVVSREEAVVMYRVLTGACRAGVQNFVNGLDEVKETYTVQELIDLTKGQYGAGAFEVFFASHT